MKYFWKLNSTNLKIVVISIIAIVILAIILVNSIDQNSPATGHPKDISNTPIYSSYKFERDSRTINIGIQPLWVYAGNLAEAMKRDSILIRDMQALGLRVKYYSFLNGEEINYFLLQGKVDGGFCGDVALLNAASKADVVVPAQIDQGFDDIIAYQFMLVKELKGKSIGYPSGTTAHHSLLKALKSEGMKEGDVNLIPMEATQMPQALSEGDVDAVAAWEPITSIILRSLPKSTVIYRNRFTGFLYFSNKFATKQPEALKLLIAAEIRASRWILSYRENLLLSSKWVIDEIKNLTGNKYELTAERFSDLVTQVTRTPFIPIIPESDLQREGHLSSTFNFLKSLKKINPSIEWDSVREKFDRKITADILNRSFSYKLNKFDY